MQKVLEKLVIKTYIYILYFIFRQIKQLHVNKVVFNQPVV
jgi:hypothetical protein